MSLKPNPTPVSTVVPASIPARASPAPDSSQRGPAETPGTAIASKPVPTPSETHRLAPPGVLYVIQYASVTTDSGVIGFVPGTRVRLVEDKGETIVVTDGTVKADMPADNLTNDLDIAALAARRDAKAQQDLTSFLLGQQAIDQAMRDKQNEAYDKQQNGAAERRRAAAIAAKGANRLDQGAYHETVSWPYYYHHHRWIYFVSHP